jgi:hypothetical protein
MSPPPFTIKQLLKPRSLIVLVVVAAAVAALMQIGGHGSQARADSPDEYASYPALESTAPTGITLVPAPSSPQATPSSGPTWPLEPPNGTREGWPISTSIRRVSVAPTGISVWIAKAIGGGVCVLLSRNQPNNGVYGVGYSCSTGEEDLADGATVEASAFPGASGEYYIAGVVPSGVSSVRIVLADGASTTVAVADNAWALEVEGQPRSYHTITAGG